MAMNLKWGVGLVWYPATNQTLAMNFHKATTSEAVGGQTSPIPVPTRKDPRLN